MKHIKSPLKVISNKIMLEMNLSDKIHLGKKQEQPSLHIITQTSAGTGLS